MISYHITRFIHSVIRENKLVHIMEFILGKNPDNNHILGDFTSEMEKFLNKENDLLFDDNKLKYLIFLDNFKASSENISDIKEKSEIEKNMLFFKLYEIPKKRNNLFIVFLIYYYIKNKNKLDIGGQEILRIIYLYFMIIIYRNRVTKEVRENLLSIDKKKFFVPKEIIKQRINAIERKYSFIKFSIIKKTLVFGLIGVIGAFSYFHFSPELIRADINGIANNETLGKVAFDSIMIGRVSDPILNGIKDIGFQNILLILVFALLIQSLKTSLSTVFFNNLLTKMFHFVWVIIKYIARIFFYVYDYITYKLETKYIFFSLDKIIKLQMIPQGFLLFVFGLLYSLIYIGVISLYLFVIIFFSSYHWLYFYIPLLSIILSLMVIYFNFITDIGNFKNFILEIENIIKDVYEKKEKSQKEVA